MVEDSGAIHLSIEIGRILAKFLKKARYRVKTIVIDIYEPYIQLIKAIFPKAKIISDINYKDSYYRRSFRRQMTQSDVLKYLLDLDPTLKATHDLYHSLRVALASNNKTLFIGLLERLIPIYQNT